MGNPPAITIFKAQKGYSRNGWSLGRWVLLWEQGFLELLYCWQCMR